MARNFEGTIAQQLLTGRNPPPIGMNTISEATMASPELSGDIPHEAATVSECGGSTVTRDTNTTRNQHNQRVRVSHGSSDR
jgi:hypothetical protein